MSPAGAVYRINPFELAASFATTAEGFAVFPKATNNPSDVKYYVVSRTVLSTVHVLNSAFQPIGNPVSLGSPAAAAAVTPDGSKLLVLAGQLRIIDTATDQLITTPFMDAGPSPSDVAVSWDSRVAFVFSAIAQRVTAVDLASYTVIGSVSLPGTTSGFVSVGPNSMVYVSATDKVLEIDGRASPLDSTALRRQWTLTGQPGKLEFTKDGTRALAVNRTPSTGSVLFFFSLDFAAGGWVGVSNTPTELQGVILDKLTVVGNNRAYSISSTISTPSRKLYHITIPDLPLPGSTLPSPAVVEAFFGGLGSVPIADSVVSSREYPEARSAFVTAPLKLLQPLANNIIYRMDLTSGTPRMTDERVLNLLPGAASFAGPMNTPFTEGVGGVVRINASQPAIAIGGRSLPIGVRVLGVTGNPLSFVPVVFSTTTSGASIEGSSTFNTNADGYAFATVRAPSTSTVIDVRATVGGTGLVTTFTLAAGAGGGGGGGGTGTGGVKIAFGTGQVVREGNLSPRNLAIDVIDAAGNPLAGAQVIWTITQGGGLLDVGEFTGVSSQRVTYTNSQGRAENAFRSGSVPTGTGYEQVVVNASTTVGNVDFNLINYRSFAEGNQVPNPSVLFVNPSQEPFTLIGRAGETLTGAIKVIITSEATPGRGTPLQNVGIFPFTGNDPAVGPVVSCVPNAVPLTDSTGTATCDLKLGGKAGSATVLLDIGSFSQRPIYLTVNPGEPGRMAIVSGDNQSGNPNSPLPLPLVVQLGDAGGNPLAGSSVSWAVISGAATVGTTLTTSDSSGRVSNTVRLGNVAGTIQIRAIASGGTQPSVTFTARINVIITSIQKVAGDSQTTFINTEFPSALTVQVNDNQNNPVNGSTVNFAVTGGSATLSAASVLTNAQGRASVTARAGGVAGPIVVTATVANLSPVSFNLNSILPGPSIATNDVYITPSGARGVVPGAIVTLAGRGIAPDLRGVLVPSTVLGPLPTRLGGVEVQFGSTLAPIFQVANVGGQESVTVQAPFDLGVGGLVSIAVRVAGGGSTVVNNIPVYDMLPGVFETIDQNNRRYAIILRPDGSWVSPENPGRRGELLRAYITGAGLVLPVAQTNVTGVPGQNVYAPVQVGLGDVGVRLVSAQYAVGLIGVYEIIFEVPQTIATGSAVNFGIYMIRPSGEFVYANGTTTSIQ